MINLTNLMKTLTKEQKEELMRYKILSVLENKFMNDKLSCIVEIDKTFIL